jgi:hypothetical protein
VATYCNPEGCHLHTRRRENLKFTFQLYTEFPEAWTPWPWGVRAILCPALSHWDCWYHNHGIPLLSVLARMSCRVQGLRITWWHWRHGWRLSTVCDHLLQLPELSSLLRSPSALFTFTFVVGKREILAPVSKSVEWGRRLSQFINYTISLLAYYLTRRIWRKLNFFFCVELKRWLLKPASCQTHQQRTYLLTPDSPDPAIGATIAPFAFLLARVATVKT